MATRLLGYYPAREVNDADTFVTVIAAVFAAFPPSLGKRVLHPVHGLAGRLKFLPTVADVVEALKAEQERRRKIHGNAHRTLSEWARREHARQEALEIELTADQRAARSKQLDDLKAKLRSHPHV